MSSSEPLTSLIAKLAWPEMRSVGCPVKRQSGTRSNTPAISVSRNSRSRAVYASRRASANFNARAVPTMPGVLCVPARR